FIFIYFIYLFIYSDLIKFNLKYNYNNCIFLSNLYYNIYNFNINQLFYLLQICCLNSNNIIVILNHYNIINNINLISNYYNKNITNYLFNFNIITIKSNPFYNFNLLNFIIL